MTTECRTITIRAKAFSTEPMGQYRCRVYDDGKVLVWDTVAGYYTSLHAMSARTMRRLYRLHYISR